MKCRNCGTEIADKALICYRCGVSTTEARYQPADLRARQRLSRTHLFWIIIAILIVLLIAAYFVHGGRSIGSFTRSEDARAAHAFSRGTVSEAVAPTAKP